MKRASFYPFRDIEIEGTDMQFDCMADDLGLTRTQKALLWRQFRDMEICFWFGNHDARDKKMIPTLEVIAFWDCNTISSADLIGKLEIYFRENRNEIGDEGEIVALNRLKAVIDAAISEREKVPS